MKLGGDVRTNRDLAPNIKGLTRVENSFRSATQNPLRSFLSRRKNPKGGYPVFPAEVFPIRGRGARTHPAPKVDPHSLQSLGWFRAPSPGGCLRATSRGRVFARRAGKGGVKRRREVASLATSIVRHWCMATRVCKKRVDGGIASRFSTSKWLARDHFFPSFFSIRVASIKSCVQIIPDRWTNREKEGNLSPLIHHFPFRNRFVVGSIKLKARRCSFRNTDGRVSKGTLLYSGLESENREVFFSSRCCLLRFYIGAICSLFRVVKEIAGTFQGEKLGRERKRKRGGEGRRRRGGKKEKAKPRRASTF